MKNINEKQAIALLKKYSSSEKGLRIVLKHSQAVKRVSLRIAKKLKKEGKGIDLNFIKTAALLHDIGRFKHPPGKSTVFHGIWGARILRKEKLKKLNKHALVAERHLGSGITKAEAKKLGLPAKNFMPKTIEEKIICYADSLVFDDKEKNLKAVLKRYKHFGKEAVKRTLKLHAELEKFIK